MAILRGAMEKDGCVCVRLAWPSESHSRQQVSLLGSCCQVFTKLLGKSQVSALTEQVVDPGSHEMTDEQDGRSHFKYEACISSAKVSIAGSLGGEGGPITTPRRSVRQLYGLTRSWEDTTGGS